MSRFPVDLPPTMLRSTLYTNNFVGNVNVNGNITSVNIYAENIYGNLTSNTWSPGNVTNLTVTGNVTAGYFIGNGALLTGVTSTLPTTANIDIVGNVTAAGNVIVAGQVNVTGNIVGQYLLGNGALLTGITAASLPSSANIDITGNVTAPGNVNVAGQVTAIGNVVGEYFIGNGALLSDVTSTLPSSANIDIIGNVVASNVLTQKLVVNSASISLGVGAGFNNQAANGIAIGTFAGGNNQNLSAISVGLNAGHESQGQQAIAIGYIAGVYSQEVDAVAIGAAAGIDSQGGGAVAIGASAGGYSQGQNSVAIGYGAGTSSLTANSIAIGTFARANAANGSIVFNATGAFLSAVNDNSLTIDPIRGTTEISAPVMYNTTTKEVTYNTTGNVTADYFIGNGSLLTGINAAALPGTANIDIRGNVIGTYANVTNVVTTTLTINSTRIALGSQAGNNSQGINTIAIGSQAATNSQGASSIAIGGEAGLNTQGTDAVAIGTDAGRTSQGTRAVAIGFESSMTNQGGNSVSIGTQSLVSGENGIAIGKDARSFTNAIVINATGSTQFSNGADTLTINPIRGNAATTSTMLMYDASTKEVTYNTSGNITATGIANVLNIIAVQGNVGNTNFSGGNVAVSGQINTLGNVVAPFFVGNGSQLSGVVATLPLSANIDIIGNITGGYANVSNIVASGQINALGNVVASNFIGNGAQLTGMNSALIQNGSSNVAVTSSDGPITMTVGGVANVLVVNTNTFEVGRNLVTYGDVTFPNLANSEATFGNYTPVVVDNSTGTLRKQPVQTPQFAGDNGFCISGPEGFMFIHKNQLWASGYGWTVSLQVFGYPQSNPLPSPVTIPTNTPITGFSDYWYQSYNAMALTTDGRVFCWGRQYGDTVANFNPIQVSLPAPAAKIYGPLTKSNDQASVTTSATFAATLGNGQLYMWGYNNWAQLGRGTNAQASNVIPAVPLGLAAANIIKVQIASGYAGMVAALEANGRVFTWGYNSAGQCGLGNTVSPITTPAAVPGFTNVTDVRCISAYSGLTGGTVDTSTCRILLSNGASFAAGWNGFGELADGTTTSRSSFVRENSNRSNIAAIGGLTDSRSSAHYIIQGDGQMLFSGYKPTMGLANATTSTPFFYNAEGLSSLGFQRNMLANVGTPIVTPRVRSIASPATGYTYYGGVIMDNTGNVYATGYNGLGNFGNGTTTNITTTWQQLNQHFPGTGSTRRANDFIMSGYENGSGGTIVTLRDGTMIGAGNNFRGTVPYETTPTQTSTPFWKYIPGYSPADVLS
jgi:alpha-tubulin suppressor-like RCC1 family protein